MSFSPDIVVTGEDSPRILLIVETKLSAEDRGKDESQLKSYMLRMRCPVGLFVTPDEIAVYRDTYTAHSEGSVSQVGVYPAPEKWTIFKTPHHGSPDFEKARFFEENVKMWLEAIRTFRSDYLRDLPRVTREALSEYVLPALAQGIVRATGPRETRLGSS